MDTARAYNFNIEVNLTLHIFENFGKIYDLFGVTKTFLDILPGTGLKLFPIDNGLSNVILDLFYYNNCTRVYAE